MRTEGVGKSRSVTRRIVAWITEARNHRSTEVVLHFFSFRVSVIVCYAFSTLRKFLGFTPYPGNTFAAAVSLAPR